MIGAVHMPPPPAPINAHTYHPQHADGAGPLLQAVRHQPRQQPQQQRAKVPRALHGPLPGREC
jgi:hypothetical protein